MVINGMSYLGKVEEKKESKSFDETQEEGQSPWQISYHGRDRDRDMDVFEISVNVEANSEVSFALRYQELLERRLSKYVQRFIVQPLQIVPNLSFKASLQGIARLQGLRHQVTPKHLKHDRFCKQCAYSSIFND